MSYVITALKIVIAIFAVIGLYEVLYRITLKLFGHKNYILAIEILTQRDAESADVLIRDALCQYLSFRSERVVVITLPHLSENEVLVGALDTYGVECYVITE